MPKYTIFSNLELKNNPKKMYFSSKFRWSISLRMLDFFLRPLEWRKFSINIDWSTIKLFICYWMNCLLLFSHKLNFPIFLVFPNLKNLTTRFIPNLKNLRLVLIPIWRIYDSKIPNRMGTRPIPNGVKKKHCNHLSPSHHWT